VPALEMVERSQTMKTTAPISCALIFCSAALAVQSASQQLPQATVLRLPAIGNGCPISMRAQHQANANRLNVDKSRPQGVAQWLRLILLNSDSSQLVAARVRVHGLSGRVRAAETLSGQNSSGQNNSDATATLEVRLAQGQGNEVYGDLRVPNMTAVLSIDLNAVTYADGSTRSFSGMDACRTVPDPLMLIAGQ
jgi:hypothetical protein